jgi:hypothetical protein
MAILSSQHHSFDIALASTYGVECAILIQHFQHWIRINRAAGRNIREGRAWTYQSRKEIQLHFPYWTFEEVKYLCEKLVEEGVLITQNFNKNKIDKTLWYAFVDEEAFKVSEGFSKNLYERENSLSRREKSLSKGKSPQPIPHTITTNTETHIKAKTLKGTNEKSASPPPPPVESFYKEKFENKVLITPEQRQRLVDKFGLEATVDHYAEKLYRYSLNRPSQFKKYKRHDLTIEDWIEKDLAKEDVKATKKQPTAAKWYLKNLNEQNRENFMLNEELVDELKADYPNECGGLWFYYNSHILKDKNNTDFDISGLVDHGTFCRAIDKKYGLKTFEVRKNDGKIR